MKLAVCFYGNVGGKKGSHGHGGYQDITEHLIKNKNHFDNKYKDVDYFVHSWSVDKKDLINNVLSPKSSIFEENNVINDQLKSLEDYGLRNINSYENMFGNEFKDFFKISFFSAQSRWYSNSKSLEMMKNYSNSKKIKYDWVLQVRLDIVFYKLFNLSELVNTNFYVPHRQKETDIAVNDMFFLSNYNNAVSFSKIFSQRDQYSIRPPVAAKQHLDSLKLTISPILYFQKDFNIVRLNKISIHVKVIRIMLHFLRIFVALQQNFIRKIEKLF